MWWQLLIPILEEVVKAILNRLHPTPQPPAPTPVALAAVGSDAHADQLAAKLEEALSHAPKQAMGGVLDDLRSLATDLVAALKAHDWAKVAAVLAAIITGQR